MSANFNNRMTSLLHALIMLPMSAAVLDLRRPWADFGTRTTDAQVAPKHAHADVLASSKACPWLDSTSMEGMTEVQSGCSVTIGFNHFLWLETPKHPQELFMHRHGLSCVK